jgi:hypothetical protein
METMKTMKNILTLTMKALILLFGLAMLYWGVDNIRSNSSEWPSTDGQIISAVENSYYDSTSTDYKITYEYQIGANKYTGSYNYFETSPTGEKTTVYYDPASPGDSVHFPGDMEWQAFWSLLFGLGCVGWVVLDVFKAFSGKKPEAVEPIEAS